MELPLELITNEVIKYLDFQSKLNISLTCKYCYSNIKLFERVTDELIFDIDAYNMNNDYQNVSKIFVHNCIIKNIELNTEEEGSLFIDERINDKLKTYKITDKSYIYYETYHIIINIKISYDLYKLGPFD